MNISKAVEAIFNKYLPSPFTIAVLLTIVTIFLALLFTKPDSIGFVGYTVDILQYWEKGIWSSSLLEFAYQMMLILVLVSVSSFNVFNTVINFIYLPLIGIYIWPRTDKIILSICIIFIFGFHRLEKETWQITKNGVLSSIPPQVEVPESFLFLN